MEFAPETHPLSCLLELCQAEPGIAKALEKLWIQATQAGRGERFSYPSYNSLLDLADQLGDLAAQAPGLPDSDKQWLDDWAHLLAAGMVRCLHDARFDNRALINARERLGLVLDRAGTPWRRQESQEPEALQGLLADLVSQESHPESPTGSSPVETIGRR